MRLDLYLTNRGDFESRNKAAAAIKEGRYAVNGKSVLKPSYDVADHDEIIILNEVKDYVARSAYKLLHANRQFNLDWSGKIVADFGASTGGFCQVLLESNALKVYAVDIGTAQLHPSIKSDPRIINMEHHNARYLKAEDFSDPIGAITADLSFISIKAILPAIRDTLTKGGEAIVLVKPQFEAGPQHLSKNGVVRDRKIHLRLLEDVALFAQNCGFGIKGISFSGLAGESGNREYLLYLRKDELSSIDISAAAHAAVNSEDHYEKNWNYREPRKGSESDLPESSS